MKYKPRFWWPRKALTRMIALKEYDPEIYMFALNWMLLDGMVIGLYLMWLLTK